jgi:hypothetical protein
MEINSINMQILQSGSSPSPVGNGDNVTSAMNRQSALANSANAGSSQAPQQLNSLTSKNFVKQEIETILTSFPPYFPAGSPQRIDLIKGVKRVQDEIKNSKLPKEVKDKLAGQKLMDTATDQEISTALKGVQQYMGDHSQSPPKLTNNSKHVEIVSITA